MQEGLREVGWEEVVDDGTGCVLGNVGRAVKV